MTRHRLLRAGVVLPLAVLLFYASMLRLGLVEGTYCLLLAPPLAFMCPLGALQVALTTGTILPLASAVSIPLLLYVLTGRLFCGWLCVVKPLGQARGQRRHLDPRISILSLTASLSAVGVASFVLKTPVFCLFCPVGLSAKLVYMATLGVLDWSFLGYALLVIAVIVASRAWCHVFCPLGATQALAGILKPVRLKVDMSRCTRCGACEKACPMPISPYKDNGKLTNTVCTLCQDCVSTCPAGAISTRAFTRFIIWRKK